ncbi:hypothetical protein [Sporolactobacillus sp. THM19-2]|uniref:hypothetical protein n=1 Tax=Sporolactobacillus sp. THM19-2 TaxID=2511171 RepID=UPI001020467F|nr:hypothetical protein [Sporolactobacillus sp. THM19-2]RYL92815.1 hypothetical protein EWH91_05840 [Sporolactobacillus sp. THM19-2]
MFLVTAVILLIIFSISQLREKPLTGKLYRLPLTLLLFSSCALSFMPSITPADWVMMTSAFIASLILGMVQGRYTPLINHGGAWYLSGSIMAVIVWFLSIPVRQFLKLMTVHLLSVTPALNGSAVFIFYFIYISGFLLGRYTMLLLRYPSLVTKTGKNEQKLRRMQAG